MRLAHRLYRDARGSKARSRATRDEVDFRELTRSVLDVPDEEPENLLNLGRLFAHAASPFKEKKWKSFQ
jgi:hypothetical protein